MFLAQVMPGTSQAGMWNMWNSKACQTPPSVILPKTNARFRDGSRSLWMVSPFKSGCKHVLRLQVLSVCIRCACHICSQTLWQLGKPPPSTGKVLKLWTDAASLSTPDWLALPPEGSTYLLSMLLDTICQVNHIGWKHYCPQYLIFLSIAMNKTKLYIYKQIVFFCSDFAFATFLFLLPFSFLCFYISAFCFVAFLLW